MQSLLILICNLTLTLVLKLCYAISDFPSSCPAYLTKRKKSFSVFYQELKVSYVSLKNVVKRK